MADPCDLPPMGLFLNHCAVTTRPDRGLEAAPLQDFGGNIPMPFNQNITRLTRGSDTATVLRILLDDPFQGLVRFENSGLTKWVNSAQLQHFGWRFQ
jgi:hypothetical protein